MAGTGAIGNVVPLPIAKPTGTSGTGAVGTVTFFINDVVIPTGVQGTGAVGTVLIRGWTVIPDSQTPNWATIDDSQTPNWVEIDTAA